MTAEPSLESMELLLFMVPAIDTMTDRQMAAFSEFVDWVRAKQDAAQRAKLFPEPMVIDFAGAQHRARHRA